MWHYVALLLNVCAQAKEAALEELTPGQMEVLERNPRDIDRISAEIEEMEETLCDSIRDALRNKQGKDGDAPRKRSRADEDNGEWTARLPIFTVHPFVPQCRATTMTFTIAAAKAPSGEHASAIKKRKRFWMPLPCLARQAPWRTPSKPCRYACVLMMRGANERHDFHFMYTQEKLQAELARVPAKAPAEEHEDELDAYMASMKQQLEDDKVRRGACLQPTKGTEQMHISWVGYGAA